MAWPTSLGYPTATGYSLETADQTIRTDMDGGAPRVRRRSTAAPDVVTLRFLFSAAQMATFRSFWETDFLFGAAWVSMPIKTGRSAGMESKECRPTSGKFKATPISDRQWAVEFQAEVRNA